MKQCWSDMPYAEESWRHDAACSEVSGDFWFPEAGGSARQAKEICAVCSVRTECLQYALENWADGTRYGIWGGTSERERRRIYQAWSGNTELDDDLVESEVS